MNESNLYYQSAEPFISNDSFIYFSDICLLEIYNEETTNDIISKGFENGKTPIVFVKTELLLYYIKILLALNKKYILITTCNDDFCVPYFELPQNNDEIVSITTKLLENTNMIRWFTKNPCIKHAKLMPIPLGPKWQYTSHNFFGEDKVPIIKILNNYCFQPKKNFNNKDLKTKMLYFNFSIGTTDNPLIKEHKNVRRDIETLFRSKNFLYNENKNFEGYIKELASYKFCLSPPGRGVDTHRTWEALMVGTIPIMMSTSLDILFENLPVIIVKDWNEINEEFLNSEYIRLQKKEYDFSILYSDYWKNEINKYRL
jgi:hypothetical protein